MRYPDRMPIVPATGRILERVLDGSFPAWGDGLTRADYERYNLAQLRTPWGRRHLDRIAMVQGPRVLASMKRYRFPARLDGRDIAVFGVAAVFTPVEERRRGHAAALIEEVLAEEAARGTDAALLFSEIGEAYYERLGFVTIPFDLVTLTVDVMRGGAPAMLVRAGTEHDLPAIAEMDRLRSARARFALVRDPDLIQFALARRRLLAGFGAPGLRHVEFHVAEEGSSAVAYVVITAHGETWTIEECGDRDPAGARLGALLQVLLAREPSQRHPVIRGWLPDGLVPPQVRVTSRVPTPDPMMIRAIRTPIDPPLGKGDVVFWHADAF